MSSRNKSTVCLGKVHNKCLLLPLFFDMLQLPHTKASYIHVRQA